jgi:hypothetical protein
VTDANEARVLNLDALLAQQRMLLHCVNKAVNSGSLISLMGFAFEH